MKFFIPFTLVTILTAIVLAQEPAAAPQVPDGGELPTIRVEVDVVNILCSVRDKKGGLVSSLSQEDFILKEDGNEQEVRYFARETDLPLTIGLLVDVSKSQENLIENSAQHNDKKLSVPSIWNVCQPPLIFLRNIFLMS